MGFEVCSNYDPEAINGTMPKHKILTYAYMNI